jgi:hypothetical protein
MSTNRTLSGLPAADGLNPEDLMLVTQAGLSKKATVGQVQDGVISAVTFQQEATEQEALEGLSEDTVMTARRVKAVVDVAVESASFVEGRECLGAFHNALIAGDDPVKVLISGDSTTRGHPYTAPRYVPQTLMTNLARRMGISGLVIDGWGRSGSETTEWLSTYLADDMAYGPKLYIWHWALNDPRTNVHGLTAEETRDNLREGLELIRADYGSDEMSIVILTPNYSNTADRGRTPEWFVKVIEYMREAARDFECCFIDIYTPWKNADSTIMYPEMSGDLVHPGNGYSLQSWSLVAETIFPIELRSPVPASDVNLVKRNHVINNAWLASEPAADNQWRGVCWAKDFARFVAVAASGTGSRAATSPDGVTWTTQTSAADDGWKAVCYSPELRRTVAVANNGSGSRMMTSDDGGETWTARTPATSGTQWTGVCWSPDRRLFVAVGLGGAVNTSPDGITWTARTAAALNNWQAICWSRLHGLFVAVAGSGTGNRVMTSYDGESWTSRTSPSDITWFAITVSERLGRFVAVANASGGSNVMTSDDGLTWTLGTGQANSMFSVACYDEIGLFAAVGGTGIGNRVATSTDGLTWTSGVSAADLNWQSVCVAAELGLLCAVAFDGTGNGVMTSVSAHSVPYRTP